MVRKKTVLAVEALEGTNETIMRGDLVPIPVPPAQRAGHREGSLLEFAGSGEEPIGPARGMGRHTCAAEIDALSIAYQGRSTQSTTFNVSAAEGCTDLPRGRDDGVKVPPIGIGDR